MNNKNFQQSIFKKLGLTGLGAVILAGAILVSLHFYSLNRQIIPAKIAHQISFAVYWPKGPNSSPDKQSIKYDVQKGVFSYIVTIASVSTTVTEQATPSEFNDIANYFSTFINHLNNYDTFGSSAGNVYLTLPANTPGDTAIINQSGTLLFAHAVSRINETNWRLFFNNLKIVEN